MSQRKRSCISCQCALLRMPQCMGRPDEDRKLMDEGARCGFRHAIGSNVGDRSLSLMARVETKHVIQRQSLSISSILTAILV